MSSEQDLHGVIRRAYWGLEYAYAHSESDVRKSIRDVRTLLGDHIDWEYVAGGEQD